MPFIFFGDGTISRPITCTFPGDYSHVGVKVLYEQKREIRLMPLRPHRRAGRHSRIKNAAHEKMKGFFQKLSAKKQGIFSKNKIDAGRPFS